MILFLFMVRSYLTLLYMMVSSEQIQQFKSISFEYLKPTLLWIWTFVSVYGIWIVIHTFSTKLYSDYCIRLSLFGFIETFIMTQHPVCKLLRILSNASVEIICSLWVIIFASLHKMISVRHPNVHKQSK